MPAIQPFPWGSLPVLPKRDVVAAERARRAIERAVKLDVLGATIEALVVAPTVVTVHSVTAEPEALATLPPARVGLHLVDGSAEVLLGMDPALATDLLRRLLERPAGLDDPRAAWSPSLQGALEAVVLEVARQCAPDRAVAMIVPPVPQEDGEGVRVRATIAVEGRPYAVGALVHLRKAPPEAPLAARGVYPVAVPLVVGRCCARPGEIAALQVGDAWSCGDGWWIDAQGVGQGVLVSPGGESGAVVDLAQDGSAVLRDEVRHLPLEAVEGNMDDATEVIEAVTEAVGDTPVVVRVELGSVSLLARDWSALRPGDVLLSDQRVGEPVRLRIGGREVARGELVNVEGELGVRITSLAGESG